MSALTLLYAEAAVAYVDSVMEWPSTNRPDDVKHRQMYRKPVVDVGPLRNEFDSIERSRGLWHAGFDRICDNVEYYLTQAKVAREHGVGECDELVAISFEWLVKIKNVPCNVSRNSICDIKGNFHAFLVLGETEAPKLPIIFNNHPPLAWLNSVWCDPWRREWFEIKEGWPSRIKQIIRDCRRNPESQIGFVCKAFSPTTDRSRWRG